MRPRPVIAIDGPAGAGKSTVARNVAKRLGFTLVDTGALYRAVAVAARRQGISWKDSGSVALLAADLVAAKRLELRLDGDGRELVILDRTDISDEIRTPEMSLGASAVSSIPEVRHALFALQRQAGENGGVVLEGRDIGTVVFPDAEIKFFLTASAEIRARRRHDELLAKGQPVDFQTTLDEVKRRDQQDITRAISPLRQAEDARFLDSSDMTADQIVDMIAETVRSKYPV
jgi:CMP/dCMP kinase